MNKICTSIEQSKKLIELGIDINTADMHYLFDIVFMELKNVPTITEENDHFILFPKDIPCWSLAALLDVIPKRIKDYNVLRTDISDNDFAIWYDEVGYGVNKDLPDIIMASAVDACCEMILKLHEFKIL